MYALSAAGPADGGFCCVPASHKVKNILRIDQTESDFKVTDGCYCLRGERGRLRAADGLPARQRAGPRPGRPARFQRGAPASPPRPPVPASTIHQDVHTNLPTCYGQFVCSSLSSRLSRFSGLCVAGSGATPRHEAMGRRGAAAELALQILPGLGHLRRPSCTRPGGHPGDQCHPRAVELAATATCAGYWGHSGCADGSQTQALNMRANTTRECSIYLDVYYVGGKLCYQI
jgi:hypothetical protein